MPITMADGIRPARREFVAVGLAAAVLPRHLFAEPEGQPMRVACRFADQAFSIDLQDNPTARDLYGLLPLDLRIEDYSTNEKIAYLPRKLSEDGAAPFGNEAAGDFCYYAPWGNIVFFHDSYRYARGLIRLGLIRGDIAPLRVPGAFPLRIETAS